MIESPTDYNNNTVYVRMGIATPPTTYQIMRRQKSELFENAGHRMMIEESSANL
ncbi:MAG: hypothetical protein WA364_13375 [Candidatus Nitrosopolaris sp.]|jgi:hypothetical protein